MKITIEVEGFKHIELEESEHYSPSFKELEDEEEVESLIEAMFLASIGYYIYQQAEVYIREFHSGLAGEGSNATRTETP